MEVGPRVDFDVSETVHVQYTAVYLTFEQSVVWLISAMLHMQEIQKLNPTFESHNPRQFIVSSNAKEDLITLRSFHSTTIEINAGQHPTI